MDSTAVVRNSTKGCLPCPLAWAKKEKNRFSMMNSEKKVTTGWTNFIHGFFG